MADLLRDVGVNGVLAVLLFREAATFVGRYLPKRENGNGNGSKANDQLAAYWREAFRSVMHEVLNPPMEEVRRSLERIEDAVKRLH